MGRASSDAADPPLRYLTDAYNPTGYSQVVAEIDGASAEARREFMYGESMLAQAEAALGGGEPGDPEWFVGDHLGSIRGLTGAGGSAIVDSAFDYSPYGQPLGGAGGAVPGAASSLTSYGYTGQWREALTGLQYHRARWLDPGAGRWLSVDPVFDFPGNYGHPYAYVGGKPTNHVDWSGESPFVEVTTVAAIVSVLASISVGFIARNQILREGGDKESAKNGFLISALLTLVSVHLSIQLAASGVGLLTDGVLSGVMAALEYIAYAKLVWRLGFSFVGIVVSFVAGFVLGVIFSGIGAIIKRISRGGATWVSQEVVSRAESFQDAIFNNKLKEQITNVTISNLTQTGEALLSFCSDMLIAAGVSSARNAADLSVWGFTKTITEPFVNSESEGYQKLGLAAREFVVDFLVIDERNI